MLNYLSHRSRKNLYSKYDSWQLISINPLVLCSFWLSCPCALICNENIPMLSIYHTLLGYLAILLPILFDHWISALLFLLSPSNPQSWVPHSYLIQPRTSFRSLWYTYDLFWYLKVVFYFPLNVSHKVLLGIPCSKNQGNWNPRLIAKHKASSRRDKSYY